MPARLAALLAALLLAAVPAAAQSDFKIGVVASLTGAFASAATDENAGVTGLGESPRPRRPQDRLRNAR